MPRLARNLIRLGALTGPLVLAASCGGEARSSAAQAGSAAPGVARAAGAEAPPAAGRASSPAALEETPLPSHRRLRAFLPEELPGFGVAHLESDHRERERQAVARGRYQAGLTQFRNAVEIEISYSAGRGYNPYESLFRAGLGDRTKIAGFEAVRDESEFRGAKRQEIYLRLSPRLWIQASGPGTFEELRDAVQTVDLQALATQAEDGSLFEESEVDRIARLLLDGEALAALLPARIGPLEARPTGGNVFREAEPMHSRATAFYGSGSLTLHDYADPRVAASVDLAGPRLEELGRMMGRSDYAVEPQPLAVAGGEGTWAVLRPGQGQAPYLVLHLTRGRLVAEYTGAFAERSEVDASMPDDVQAAVRAADERKGAGAFSTVEEQRDAVLAAFEAIHLDETP